MSQKVFDHEVGHPKIEPNQNDPRTLQFSDYIDSSALSTLPLQHDWTIKVRKPWRRMGNWTLSDCTCAAAGHMIECWTANTTHEDVITTKEVVTAFSALTGYDPATGKNDVGVNYLDALKYWRNTGIGDHKIKLFTLVDHSSHDLVRAAVYLFGGAYLGLDLPNTIIHKDIWEREPGDLTGDRAVGSFGGHAVNIVAYDENYITCVSWGKIKKLTWEFFDTYCYCLYAIVTDEFFKDDQSALGLNLPLMEENLLKITKKMHKHALQEQIAEEVAKNGDAETVGVGEASSSGTRGRSSGGSAGSAGLKGGSSGASAGSSGASAGATGHAAGTAGTKGDSSGHLAGNGGSMS